jgi:hypothetical protein
MNYIRKVNWDITLGNNFEKKLEQDAYFKDLRVWSSNRSVTDLYTYRLRQVPASMYLEVNLKLMDGSPTVINYAPTSSYSDLDTAVAEKVTFVASDGDNVVCAANMYFDFDSKACTVFPFPDGIPIVYRVVNSVQHGHQMILSRDFGYTQSALPGIYQPEIGSFWTVRDDSEVTKNYLQGRQSLPMLSFDAIYMGDGEEYLFEIRLTDKKTHNFYQMRQQSFYPRKCLLVVDSITQESVNEFSAVIATDSTEDLCFEFEIARIDGCEDEYENTL